jgi:HPt (histidine-containing phosphotransfer) domain-containing protein
MANNPIPKLNPKKPVFSLDLLKKMGGGNNRFVDDMLRIYIEETPKTIKKLKDALHTWDVKVLKSTAHKLRSPAAMMCVPKAVKLTEFIEINASEVEKKDEVKMASIDLINLINLVIKQVEQFLDLP